MSSSSSSTSISLPVSPTATTIPLNTPEKVSRNLRRTLNLSSERANSLAIRLFAEQKSLLETGQEVVKFEASDELPHSGILTHHALIIEGSLLGSGAHTQVSEAHYIPTKRHRNEGQENVYTPSKSEVKALKKARHTGVRYSANNALLEEAIRANGGIIPDGIDKSELILHAADGIAYSVNELRDGDLTKANFHLCAKPATAMVKVFLDVAKALAFFQRPGIIHRDIKGANILFKRDTEPHMWKGILADYDFITKESQDVHRTVGTCEFLDPLMFGPDAYSSLYNQIVRNGIQTKAGDIYALGLTIYYYGLYPLIKHLSKKIAETDPERSKKILEHLKATHTSSYSRRVFDPQDLVFITQKHGYATFIDKNPKTGLEKIEIHKDIDVVYKNLIHALDNTRPYFENENAPHELRALRDLAAFSCEMRTLDLSVRLTVEKVQIRLQNLFNHLVSLSQNDCAQSSGLS